MSDDAIQHDSDESTLSIEDLQKQLVEKDKMLQNMQQQFTSVKAKADQLLDETKKAKAKAREEAEAAERAKIEKAQKNGDYEQLLKSSEAARQAVEKELEGLRYQISSEKIKTEAFKLANELADGPNAEILSEFISRRIKYTDDGLKVLDGNGDLTVSSLDDLKTEFSNSPKFQALIRGSRSSGGGAPGDGGSASKANKRTQAEFEKMTPQQRMEFAKKGGEIID